MSDKASLSDMGGNCRVRRIDRKYLALSAVRNEAARPEFRRHHFSGRVSAPIRLAGGIASGRDEGFEAAAFSSGAPSQAMRARLVPCPRRDRRSRWRTSTPRSGASWRFRGLCRPRRSPAEPPSDLNRPLACSQDQVQKGLVRSNFFHWSKSRRRSASIFDASCPRSQPTARWASGSPRPGAAGPAR